MGGKLRDIVLLLASLAAVVLLLDHSSALADESVGLLPGYEIHSITGPVKVGFGLSLSGDNSQAGRERLSSYKRWAEQINQNGGLDGRPVQLIFYDDQSQPTEAQTIYRKLVELDGADVLGFPVGDRTIAQANTIARAYGMKLTFGIVSTTAAMQAQIAQTKTRQEEYRLAESKVADPGPKTADTLNEFGLSGAVFSNDCARPVKYGGFAISWTVNSSEPFYTVFNKGKQSKVFVLGASRASNGNMQAVLKEAAGPWTNIYQFVPEGYRVVWSDIDGKPQSQNGAVLRNVQGKIRLRNRAKSKYKMPIPHVCERD